MSSSFYFTESWRYYANLEGHKGCVNTIQYSQSGNVVITGSDDRNVNIFDAYSAKLKITLPTHHSNNIFYAKDLLGSDCNTIVTCAADGKIILMSGVHGRVPQHSILHRHQGSAHRIAMIPDCAHQFYSCGGDGKCCFFDLRDNSSSHKRIQEIQFVNLRNKPTALYGIGVNPLNPNELAFGGACNHVSIFDIRNSSSACSYLCPLELETGQDIVSAVKYDVYGEHVLASYNDNDIFRMNVQLHSKQSRQPRQQSTVTASSASVVTCSLPDINPSYATKYSGHRNSQTIKQVNFYGPNSEYVISGSDCGHIFIWDTYSGGIVNIKMGDDVGAVNCLSPHPSLPFIATSGLDDKAKIWGLGRKNIFREDSDDDDDYYSDGYDLDDDGYDDVDEDDDDDDNDANGDSDSKEKETNMESLDHEAITTPPSPAITSENFPSTSFVDFNLNSVDVNDIFARKMTRREVIEYIYKATCTKTKLSRQNDTSRMASLSSSRAAGAATSLFLAILARSDFVDRFEDPNDLLRFISYMEAHYEENDEDVNSNSDDQSDERSDSDMDEDGDDADGGNDDDDDDNDADDIENENDDRDSDFVEEESTVGREGNMECINGDDSIEENKEANSESISHQETNEPDEENDECF